MNLKGSNMEKGHKFSTEFLDAIRNESQSLISYIDLHKRILSGDASVTDIAPNIENIILQTIQDMYEKIFQMYEKINLQYSGGKYNA